MTRLASSLIPTPVQFNSQSTVLCPVRLAKIRRRPAPAATIILLFPAVSTTLMCLIPVLPAAPPATSPVLSTTSVCSAHPHVPPVLDQSLIAQPAPHHSHICLLTLMLGRVLPRVHLGSMVTPHCQCPCVWLVSLPVRHAQPRQCV